MMKIFKKGFKIIFFILFGLIMITTSINAADFWVTTTQDIVEGSLRAAIKIANNNGEDDTIYLPAGLFELTGDADEDSNIGGDMDINTSQRITIIGSSARSTIIDGNQIDRVFHIIKGIVFISGITIRGGKTGEINLVDQGNLKGGGINNCGELTLSNCMFYNNISLYSIGGAIFNNGTITCYNCSIHNNSTGNGRSFTYYANNGGDGGGIYNNNMLTLTNCSISNNNCGDGGDSYSMGGNGGNGGGIYNNYSGRILITHCTIANNAAGHRGYYDSWRKTGDPKDNCYSYYDGYDGDGGGILNNLGTIVIQNTIISNNFVYRDGIGPDCSGRLDSTGYNLIQNPDNCTILGVQNGVITGVDPLLEPLNDNGGSTDSHALLPGSPAIDAGYSFGITIDQRGFVRPKDVQGIPNLSDGSDLGAYEYQSNLSACQISGKITYYGVDLPGVRLTFSNNGGNTDTDSLGNYSHSLPYGWTGTVTPYDSDYIFEPLVRTYNSLVKDWFDQNYIAIDTIPPEISLNKTILYFGADRMGNNTSTQPILITNNGGGILKWTILTDSNWLNCTPTSGIGTGVINISIEPKELTPGTYNTSVIVRNDNAINSQQLISIFLTVYDSSDLSPFGSFDSPINGSTAISSIPVTGWALDNIGIEGIGIYRKGLIEERTDFVYIGNAVQVEGARPDIEVAYPGYPFNYKAGWGYMLLTNILPNQGNGTFTLYAKALDLEGNEVILGETTIQCDNKNAVKPFGAIDTPTQGGTISGSNYVNFGWALTPQPNSIPINGSTITVWIDGLSIGHPVYNRYREDIATLFPGYNNTSGAGGYFSLDTTNYTNGTHTIAWTIKDNAGNTDGIGSRYFSIQNTTTGQEVPSSNKKANSELHHQLIHEIDAITPFNSNYPIQIKKGYNYNLSPTILYPNEHGFVSIEIHPLERIEISMTSKTNEISNTSKPVWYGRQLIRWDNGKIGALPIGSNLNSVNGTFAWQPGPGFIGNYEMVFIEQTANIKKRINVMFNIRTNFLMKE